MNRERPRREIEEAVAAGDLPRLLEISGLLHGHYCPGSAMGVKAAARAVRDLGAKSTGMEEIVAIVETNSCFADGVQMVTGCSLGNNGLVYRDFGKTALTLARRDGEAVRVAIRPDVNVLDRYPEAAALFQKVIKERRGTAEEDEKLRKMWIDVSFAVLDIPDDEFLKVEKMTIAVPAYARIFGSARCSVCGESIMEPRARLRDGRPVCLTCSGQDYYQLAGDGITAFVPRPAK
jgi:formylmethanofuran dehydrogenase subunit E